MKTIVISAINLRSGGPLSILKDCIASVDRFFGAEHKLVVLVHKKELLSEFQNVTCIEYPYSTSSYLLRCWYEYFHFKKISRKLHPYLWLSLHDMTPNVRCDVQAVYCHNATPFYNMTLREFAMEPKLGLFNLLYRYVYAINIKKNNFVIVQQDWIRRAFQSAYGLENVVVAHPSVTLDPIVSSYGKIKESNSECIFFFPTLPRIFKNIEVICEATAILQHQNLPSFRVVITIDGTETLYSKQLFKKYSKIRNLDFIGRISRDEVFQYYNEMDCLIFPSRLETWGLPITECKHFNKPMLVADLDYAHETVGDYDKVSFFNSNDPTSLADKMKSVINGTGVYEQHSLSKPEAPYVNNWHELFNILLGGQKGGRL